MTNEIKQLAAIAIFCFFPAGLVGLLLYKKSPSTALFLFRSSIYFFLGLTSVVGIYVVLKGGEVIPVMGSFF